MLRRDFAGTHIRVVEDNPTNQAVIIAIDKAQKRAYPLILMDMKMTRLDGLEATREIRRLPGYEITPIIAVTANALSENREQYLQAGMSDYLAKPLDPNLIDAILLNLLSANRLPCKQ